MAIAISDMYISYGNSQRAQIKWKREKKKLAMFHDFWLLLYDEWTLMEKEQNRKKKIICVNGNNPY